MKKIIFVLFLCHFWACDNSPTQENALSTTTPTNTETEAKYAAFEFEHMEYDFGMMDEGEVVKHSFSFKNVGEVPLVISSIDVSCGCTTTDYPKNPVPVGETATIEVQFNSTGKSGKQNKPVTVFANVNGGKVELNLYAQIQERAISQMKGPQSQKK